MIKLAVIAPEAYLEEFSSFGDIEMCISSVALEQPVYLNYYKKAVEKGRIVIMDNGVFELEHPLTNVQLLALAKEIKPTFLVTPEIIRNREETMKATRSFIHDILLTDVLNYCRLLTVAQGKDPYDFADCCEEINNEPLISMLGIPFGIEYWDHPGSTRGARLALNRVHLVKHYLPPLLSKSIHLMGCGDPIELLWQNIFNADKGIFSLDSSSAVVHGMAGIRLTPKGLPGEKISAKLDFKGFIDDKHFSLIHENILTMKMLAQGKLQF